MEIHFPSPFFYVLPQKNVNIYFITRHLHFMQDLLVEEKEESLELAHAGQTKKPCISARPPTFYNIISRLKDFKPYSSTISIASGNIPRYTHCTISKSSGTLV